MEMSIDQKPRPEDTASYRRHRNMWFVILGVLVGCRFLPLAACLRLGGQLTKKAQILQDQPIQTEQTGSTGAYENVEW